MLKRVLFSQRREREGALCQTFLPCGAGPADCVVTRRYQSKLNVTRKRSNTKDDETSLTSSGYRNVDSATA